MRQYKARHTGVAVVPLFPLWLCLTHSGLYKRWVLWTITSRVRRIQSRLSSWWNLHTTGLYFIVVWHCSCKNEVWDSQVITIRVCLSSRTCYDKKKRLGNGYPGTTRAESSVVQSNLFIISWWYQYLLKSMKGSWQGTPIYKRLGQAALKCILTVNALYIPWAALATVLCWVKTYVWHFMCKPRTYLKRHWEGETRK